MRNLTSHSKLMIDFHFTWIQMRFVFWYLCEKLKESGHTLSACLKQSILLILPFWSGLLSTQLTLFLPVIPRTKSSLHSWVMSFLNFPNRRDAHFCFTSSLSFYLKTNSVQINEKIVLYLIFYIRKMILQNV